MKRIQWWGDFGPLASLIILLSANYSFLQILAQLASNILQILQNRTMIIYKDQIKQVVILQFLQQYIQSPMQLKWF